MADPRTLGDLYEELGVPRVASRDEIAAAFRARAKELHPDARPGDAESAERFKRVGAAYRVLSDPDERARYDAGSATRAIGAATARAARSAPPRPPGASPSSVPSTPGGSGAMGGAGGSAGARPRGAFRLTRRAARWAVIAGVILLPLGIAVSVFVLSLQRHDSDLQSRGVAAIATEVEFKGERRLEFTTPGGRVIRGTESVRSGVEQPALGSQVPIHYDRSDPTNIVTDESHTARNITLWIVAVKFVIGGVVLIWFGARRLRRAAA